MLSRARHLAEDAGLAGAEWRVAAALADLCIEDGRADDARRHLIRARSTVDRISAGLTDPGIRSRFRLGAARVIEGASAAERR